MHHLYGVFRRANDPGLCPPPARNRPETVNQVHQERNAMNRRELHGVAGGIGAGMTLGCEHVFSDGHGKSQNNMNPLGNHHITRFISEAEPMEPIHAPATRAEGPRRLAAGVHPARVDAVRGRS